MLDFMGVFKQSEKCAFSGSKAKRMKRAVFWYVALSSL
jgi:hypothetical protein